jgi:hypothetical protein
MSKYAQGKYQIKNPEKYMGKRLPSYRSSWEFTFMSFCDNNPAVIQWVSEGVKIPYFNPVSGKQTIYVPDFLIVYVDAGQKQHTELIEIKPLEQTVMESARTLKDKYSVAVNLAKWQAADSWCKANNIKFRVLTQYDIFKNLKR